jgi:hypothetical protein
MRIRPTARKKASRWAALALAGAALLAPLTGLATATATTAHHQVAAAKDATSGFTHPGAARHAGYALLKDQDNIACIAMKGMGAMGIHYANGNLVDGKIQVRHPEALVYRFARNGHLRLAALEYLVPQALWRENHPTGRPELFGHRFNFTPDGNRFGLPAFYSLHAWFFHDNPAGRYAMFNPSLFCPPGV